MNTDGTLYTENEIAGNMMEDHDKKEQLISVESILQRQGTFSGLNDFDYQDLANLTEGRIKDLTQIRTLNRVPIPNEIMEHFKNIKCHCRMGLFPEIGRAWLTIDSDIYIWTYEHARDVAYFDGLSYLIVGVGLIKPKPNVFINDVKYLLTLTTPTEIIVLGVTFNDTAKSISSPSRSFVTSSFEEMQLMNKPIFVLNTDNVTISCVEGSADGRIFLGGKDGCLYEVCYQAESNWFGKRCKKVNHSQGVLSYVLPGFLKGFSEDPVKKIVIDNQRNMLYLLTEKGAIEFWDLRDNSANRLARFSQNDITNAAIMQIKTVDSSIFKPVIDICVLSPDEYPSMCMIAVTQSGVRLYFGAYAGNYQTMLDPQQQQIQKLTSFSLHHVRLPAGYTPNATSGKPRAVHTAYYNSGTMLMVSSPQPDLDILWSFSSEPFIHSDLSPQISQDSQTRMLTESSSVMHLDGLVWAIAEIKEKTQLTLKFPLKETQSPKKVILLTSQGAHIVELLGPVDILQQLFLASHGAHHDAIKAFFELNSEPFGCATALHLACMEPLRGTEMMMWAAQAFFRYGGEPTILNQQQIQQQIQQGYQEGGPRMFMSTPYAQTRPIPQSPMNMMHSSFQQPQTMEMFNFVKSSKHGGLYIHVARILRPIWNRRCVNMEKLASTITIYDCNQILSDLFAIRSFLEANTIAGLTVAKTSSSNLSNQFTGSNGPYGMVNGFSSNQIQQQLQIKKEEAIADEKKTLDALFNFIKYVCEVISLWKILCEHQMHVLLNQLPQEHRQVLEMCNFRDLIVSRTDLCAYLIVTIINSYLNDNASVKSISEKLREICPTLYRNEDAVSHKATEILKLSKTCTNEDEKVENFLKALDLCCDAAPKLPLANICQQFSAAGFFEGVIKLCTIFANKLDPNENALHFYRNNYPFDPNQMQAKDQEGYIAYSNRMKCYEEVKNMFQYVYRTLNASAAQNEQQNINQQLQQILNVALQSSDQLLHVAVYEWMLFNNLLLEMLSITNNSLGDFLQRSVQQTPINLSLADLLWKYYERNQQYALAAKTLDKLATLHSDTIPLTKRIEYLARAVMCMRSDAVGYSVHHGEMLRDLEDKLEVAQVQKQIYDTLTSGIARVDPHQVREAARNLDIRLFNMSQLYSDFAENFDLWECQLTILNCSHHNEPRLINSVWSHILDRELEEGGSPTEKAQRLLSKVHSLSNELGVSPCFPLDFLIRELELRCFQLRLIDSPVPQELFKMSVDLDQILDIYTHIVTANDRIWMADYDELFLIRSIKNLLVSIINRHLNQSKNRRRTLAKIEDLISSTLNALYIKQGTNETQAITEELRSIRQTINQFN